MTRKNITTAEITAGRTDAELLLSFTSADAADAERAVPPFRLTQLVMARFDMDSSRLPSFLTSAPRRQHQLRKTRMRNFMHICGASLIDTDWIACSSRMHRVNTTTRLGREATIIWSTPCIPRIWKRGAPTIETCIPYSRCSQPR